MKALLKKLTDNNILLEVVNGELRAFTSNPISPELVAEIKEKKQMLLRFLKATASDITDTKIDPVIKNLVSDSGYLVSSSQRRLWILSQLEGASLAYHIPGVYVFEGDFDQTCLEYALKEVVFRHESLRTVFRENEWGDLRQYIQSVEEIGFTLERDDLQGLADQEALLKASVQASLVRPFDLSRGPLLRVTLYQMDSGKWLFSYVMHHIISDGWSMGILIRETMLLYNSRLKGEASPLLPLGIQYKDYAGWQQSQLSDPSFSDHKAYWLEQFSGELPVLNLPSDYSRPALKTYNGGTIHKQLGAGISKGLRSLSQESGATLYMGLLSAVTVLLYRYSGQEDIIIGSPIAGRDHRDLEDQIGFYVNTLALRLRFSGDQSYRELLDHSRQVTLGAYEHQIYPFDELVDSLQLKRDMSRNPLFDVQVVMQNIHTSEASQGSNMRNVKVAGYDHQENPVSKFDLLFSFKEQDERIHINIQYNKDIYSHESILQMSDHFVDLVSSLISHPDQAISEIRYLSDAVQQELLDKHNSNAGYPFDKTIVDLFGDSVKNNPNGIALVFGDTSLSYDQLDQMSNQFAWFLRDKYTIQPDDRVGLLLERSSEMVVSILGVLKAGGAYVPIDPDYPAERIGYIKEDSSCKVIVDKDVVELFHMEESQYPVSPPPLMCKSEHLAYVIYTSGSTGVPKGCMIEHRNVVRLFKTESPLFDFSSADVWTMFHSYCFDFSVWEMYGALLFGGKLIIVPSLTAKDPASFLEVLVKEGVTVLNQTPSAFYNLIKASDDQASLDLDLRYVIFGGEALRPSGLKLWKKRFPGVKLINMYGITETTVHVTYKELTDEEIDQNRSNIGRPIPTLYCYVLDKHLRAVPLGVTGELYVGGEGVCRGYMNNADLTLQRFIPDPYRAGSVLYRSGDTVRYLSNGDLEYIGRSDDQVKIRGYRIELGEIESALLSMAHIDSATVQVRENRESEKELIAFFTSRTPLVSSDLRIQLNALLPSYMVPGIFIQLENMPLTSNGKIDVKQLPFTAEDDLSAESTYVAPENAIQEQVAVIWQQLLSQSRVGIRNSFFDLGGDSIKVLRLVAALRKQLQVEVPVAEVYKNNTIEGLVSFIFANKQVMEDSSGAREEYISKIKEEFNQLKEEVLSDGGGLARLEEVEDIYPMSDIEKGMVFESLTTQGSRVYNDQLVKRQSFSNFDIVRFMDALRLLVEKHSILRTAFNISDYRTEISIIYREVTMPVYYEDVSDLRREEQEEKIQAYMNSDLENPFPIQTAPLWRMRVFNTGNDHIVFVFNCHHAIIDGWSDSMLMTELNNLYLTLADTPSYRPQGLKTSYKDFVIQQAIDIRDTSIRNFWQEELSEFRRPDLFTSTEDFRIYTRTLEAEDHLRLQALAKKLGTSVKVVSLSAFLYLLKIIGSDNQVITGLVTNNRPSTEDSDKVLGCFLNTIPLKVNIGSERCSGFIGKVHQKLIALKDKESLSLLQITQLSNLNSGSKAIFDSFFNYVDFHSYESLKQEGSVNPSRGDSSPLKLSGNILTNTNLDFTINATGNVFHLDIRIRNSFRCGMELSQFGELYLSVLNYMAGEPDRLLSDLEYLPSAQWAAIRKFNSTGKSYEASGVIALFEKQVKATGERAALTFEGESFTYSELNGLANRLGRIIKSSGAVPGDSVAVVLDRSCWSVISILAVLKANCVYLPIDKQLPLSRIEYILKESGCTVLITDIPNLSEWGQPESLNIINIKEVTEAGEDTNLGLSCHLDEASFIIYTSGSTGTPKGVEQTHRTLLNLTLWAIEDSGLTTGTKYLQFSSFSFDLSVLDTFFVLCSGGELYLSNDSTQKDLWKLRDYIVEQGVTTLSMPYAALRALFSEVGHSSFSGHQIKEIISTGEQLYLSGSLRFFLEDNQQITIHNFYGPTETHVVTAARYCSGTGELPIRPDIGQPINNSYICIVDSEMRLVPLGVEGEILIGGDNLALGYKNRPDLTAEKFISDPHQTGRRLYRSGDIGKWLPGGSIEYLTRKDSQIKINGYRIELNEVESALRKLGQIEDVAILVKELNGENELIAYLVSKDKLTSTELRTALKQALPQYMLPHHYVQIDKLPLTLNGKVDKRQLPDVHVSAVGTGLALELPGTAIEETLAGISREILGREVISITDNFFDLGIDSIKIIRFIARIKRLLLVDVDIKTFFLKPTIKEIAKEIDTLLWLKNSEKDQQTNSFSDKLVF